MMSISAEKMPMIDSPVCSVDLSLTALAAGGDADALRRLANRLFDHVRRTMSYLVSGEEAQDLAQAAMIRILRSAGSFRGESSLEFWADRIAARTFMSQLTKDTRRRNLSENVWQPAAVALPMDEETERIRTRQRLSLLLDELPSIHRTAVVMHYLLGYPIGEVAQITEVPINTVRGRLRSGRKQMEKLILADPMLKDWAERRNR